MTIAERAFAFLNPGCRIIDAHTHICHYNLSGWHQQYSHTDTQTVLDEFERLGIGCIVTAPHQLVAGYMELANSVCAESIAAFPGKVYGYISVVPICGIDAVKKELNKYAQKKGFVGIKFLPGLYHGALTAPEYAYALDFADEMRCPVLCHVWGDDPKLDDVSAVLEKRRSLKFIIAHQGGGYASETDRAVKITNEYPNAYIELCGSLENHYGVEDIVALAGEDRVIFGTDQINLDPKYELGRVAFAPLSDRVKEKIFAGNFLSLMKDSQLDRIEN